MLVALLSRLTKWQLAALAANCFKLLELEAAILSATRRSRSMVSSRGPGVLKPAEVASAMPCLEVPK